MAKYRTIPMLPTASRLPRNSISEEIAAVFIVILFAAMTNIMVVRNMLSEVNGVAETMNVAGKLRMLSQKVAFEATKALRRQESETAKVNATLNDFETALMTLAHGGNAFGYDVRKLSPRHQPLLDTLRRDWAAIRARTEVALATRGTDFDVTSARITEDAALLLADGEELVHSLTSEAQQTQTRALWKMYALLLFDALVLTIAFVAVRRRIVRPLRDLAEHSRALADGNFHINIAHNSRDEIGQLANSFHDAAQRIGTLISHIDHDRQSLRQAESMFRGFAENSVVGVYIAQNGQFRFVNPKMAQMFAYSQEEMISSVGVYDLVEESERDIVEKNIRRRLRGETAEVHYERRARRKDGSAFDVEVFGSLMKIDGEPATIGIMLDISERKQLDLALRVLSACNEALVRANDEAALLSEVCRIEREISGHPFVWVGFADDGEARTVRPAALAEAHEGALRPIVEHVRWDDSIAGQGVTGTAIRRGEVVVLRDMQANTHHAPWREFMVRYGILSAMSLPLRAGNLTLGAMTIYSRVANAFGADEVRIAEKLADNLAYGIAALRADAARRRYAQQLEYHAGHDILTGLPNRALLKDRLKQAIAYAARHAHPVWVLFLDLDRFKCVNDSLGHKAGDHVLEMVAARLLAAVRESDTVARLGGDEFVLVLPERIDERLATGIVLRIIESVAMPLTTEGHEFFLGSSIGVAVYPGDGEDPETLIKNADIAMYRAKETGRNNFQFYTPAMNDRLLERLRIEADLRCALERGEFMLHYQPQVDVDSGRIVGMEALIRWNHPRLGLLSPLRFVGLAEETGLIVPIGDWVLRTACTQAAAWRDAGLGELRIGVNLSARQFDQHDLARSISTTLHETTLPPHLLKLELTESLVMSDIEHAIVVLGELKALGVQVELDDFGTGHSSLLYLKRLPIDTLKIDQCFVRDIAHVPDDAAIVASIISLAHNLGRHVIAEGVETREQLDYLQQHRCHEMQGYYFSRPVPAGEFEQLLLQCADGADLRDRFAMPSFAATIFPN